jgi:hypothetical protein
VGVEVGWRVIEVGTGEVVGDGGTWCQWVGREGLGTSKVGSVGRRLGWEMRDVLGHVRRQSREEVGGVRKCWCVRCLCALVLGTYSFKSSCCWDFICWFVCFLHMNFVCSFFYIRCFVGTSCFEFLNSRTF